MRKIHPFNCADVLQVLLRSQRGRVWSSIAAELLAIPRESVRIEHVRGVRDCVRRLQAQGLVSEPRHLVFTA